MTLDPGLVERLVRAALDEDLHQAGDLTSQLTVPQDATLRGVIVARQGGVIAGLPLVARTFHVVDDRVEVRPAVEDGSPVAAGDTVCAIEGPARAVLTGERVALNFLGQLSGIASLTADYVRAVAGTNVRILDTRKTHAGLRAAEKYAVRMGGGHNHRFGLFDAILIKDNHIAAAGGVTPAIAKARDGAPAGMPVEVEVESLPQLEEALAAGAEAVLLDNMTPDMLRAAVTLIGGRASAEASGGVTLATVRSIAEAGVDAISVGALTHSAPALDVALEVTI